MFWGKVEEVGKEGEAAREEIKLLYHEF